MKTLRIIPVVLISACAGVGVVSQENSRHLERVARAEFPMLAGLKLTSALHPKRYGIGGETRNHQIAKLRFAESGGRAMWVDMATSGTRGEWELSQALGWYGPTAFDPHALDFGQVLEFQREIQKGLPQARTHELCSIVALERTAFVRCLGH